MVLPSMGKSVTVQPNSGDILPMVALSGTERLSSPGPNTSTNFPTTPYFLRTLAIVNTKSVAVDPNGSLPVSFNPITSGMMK